MSEQPIQVTVDADLQDLIPGFLERRREDVVKLREAIEASDLETLRVTGHSMKGTGGGYGFDGLSEIGAAIEAAAKQGAVDTVRDLVVSLVDYLDRVQIRFE